MITPRLDKGTFKLERCLLSQDDPYGPKRLVDARFDVARLLRGALLTLNRDVGEGAVKKAIDELPEIPRLFAQMQHCHPNNPIREAARQALNNLNEIERIWNESTGVHALRPWSKSK